MVFGDYECPYCTQFDSAFRTLRDSVGDAVSLLHVHFPLSYHKWALPAAQIAECAAEQGLFGEMHSLLYQEQRRTPTERRSWQQLVSQLGPGLREDVFAGCMSTERALARISRGRELGDSLGVSSTPTILINGFLYPALSAEHLSAEFAKHFEAARTGGSWSS